MSFHKGLVVAAFMIALSFSAIYADMSDASSQIGVGYGYDSPSGYYTLQLQYFDDDSIAIQATYEGTEGGSELNRSVFLQLYQNDTKLVETGQPVKFAPSFIWADLYGSVLPDGDYTLKVVDPGKDLIVLSKLAVGVSDLTIEAPSEGSISPGTGTYTVPNGTVLSADDAVLTVSFDDTVLYTFTADPPEGKAIDGWYSNDSRISSLTVADDMDIEVRWASASVTYTLTYAPNGGSGGPGTESHESLAEEYEFTVPSSAPTRSGYVFKGWSDTGSAPAQYYAGSKITLQSSSPTKTVMAVWEQEGPGPGPVTYNYVLKYDANGGSGAPSTQRYTTSSPSYTFAIPGTIPSWDSHEFLGWGDSASGGASYQPGSTITVNYLSPTKTLYAVWKETPVVPDPKDVTISVDEIYIPQGDSWKLSFTVDPPEAASAVVWKSSDDTVATVSGGTVTALKEGTATITAYDREGKALASVTIEVVPSSERTVEEETETEAEGSIIATYEIGPEGERVLVNPIVINPGDLKRVTEDQVLIAEGYIDILVGSGVTPQVIIPTTEQTVTLPAELLQAIAESEGSLTITEGDVTMVFSAAVLSELGYNEDLELVVIPVEVKEESDLPEIDGDSKIYDIYILLDGQRVTRIFENQIPVTVSYQLEDGRTVDRLHVYYINVEPFEEIRFTYDSEGVHFGVHHFSHYALVYDTSEDSEQCCIWCWILIAAIVILVLFLLWFFFAKRIKVVLDPDGGRFMFEPEGWSTQDDGTFVRRFRYREESDAFPVPVRDGMRFDGWDPQPDQRIISSSNHKAVWSDPYAGRIGPR